MTSKEHPTATITTPNSTPGQSGRFGSERVAAFRRNQWPLSSECAINGKRMYLWRAVDSEGEVLDFLVQSRRNKKAALKLMRKLLKKQGYAPNKVVTDKLPSYGAALRDLNMTGETRYRRTEQQSGGEFAPAGSTTRTQDAGLQVIRIGAKVSLHPRRHLQHLQCPTSSDHSQDNAPIPR